MDLELIRGLDIAAIEQTYDKRDTILYALGLGYGENPLDEQDLPFVYEEGLRILPSYANLLCHPGFWAQRPEFDIDWVRLLHAEQDFVMHRPLPATGTLRGTFRVAGVEDKGADRGALLHQEKALFDVADDSHVATVRSTLFLRGDGGQGGYGEGVAPAKALPDRAPDRIVTIATSPRQALVYRLSGDWNPIHADPAIARKAGFDAPILHGLCTNGIACRALVREYCGNDPRRLIRLFVRFTKPVIPGETIRFEFFEEGEGEIRFRALIDGDDRIVLDRCTAAFA
ncbi:Acyl dehydratase [Sphingopyxis sp. YR583]|nr:Acyl dehydratase [Sphingopyxis sp. YR583]